MATDEKLVLERLDVDNYATWSIRMQALLMVKGLWDVVTGEATDPAADKKAQAHIILHVKDHHLSTLVGRASSKNMWETLKAMYDAKSNARKLVLRRELTQLKMSATEPLTVYAARAKDLQTQLRSAGDEVKDQEMAIQFLAGLPPAYGMISTVLTAGDQALKIDDMLPKLLQVEQLAQTERPSEAALLAKPSGGYGSARGNGSRGNNNGSFSKQHSETRKCHYCGKKGHLIGDCMRRKREERSGQSQRSQYGAIALTASTAAPPANGMQRTRWVLDTGASRHMTADRSILLNARQPNGDITITFGNGGIGKATAVGEVLLNTQDATFHLSEVLYIPEATENLISVRGAASRGLDFKFCADRCEISRSGKTLASAASVGDTIYCLEGWSEKAATERSEALSANTKVTPRLWHERFGHLGYDNLVQLTKMVTGIHTTADEFKAAMGEGDGLCEPCVLGKQHRNPFTASASKTTRPLALVHTDVCGPLPITSMGGNNYFVTLLDDYSKLSAVQPLVRKSDVATAVKDLLLLLQNQSGYNLQRLRCDNGSEYINADLKAFCRANGIQLETTVRYTPEQNGAAERLNRTLMEKVRPMLTASGLPKYLWAEAVVTANYVRNRSPVSDRDKTPYELFYGTKPDVANLRTFGARAYALTPKPLRNKLANTSEPGRFMGYPSGTKGYKILLDSGRMVISRDVTFLEAGSSTGSPASEQKESDIIDTGDDVAAGYAEPVGADEPMAEEQAEPAAAPPGGSRQQTAPSAGAAAGKRPKRTATEVPASIWREESYKITGRKRNLAGTAYSAVIDEPATLDEALASEQAEFWQQAANDEMASLVANGTWTVEPVPPGVKPIPIKEGLWLRTLLCELGLEISTVTICADNQSAIKLLKNPVFSMRSKHIDVIFHFARERVARKDVNFKYIPTTEMVADGLTKPLPSVKLNYCRTEMGIGSCCEQQ